MGNENTERRKKERKFAAAKKRGTRVPEDKAAELRKKQKDAKK